MIDMCKSHKNMPMCLHISGQYFDTESYNVTLSVKLHFFLDVKLTTELFSL